MPYETSRNMVILLVLALSIACIIFGVVLCCIYSRAQKRFSNARTFTKKTSRDPIETALLSTQKVRALEQIAEICSLDAERRLAFFVLNYF